VSWDATLTRSRLTNELCYSIAYRATLICPVQRKESEPDTSFPDIFSLFCVTVTFLEDQLFFGNAK